MSNSRLVLLPVLAAALASPALATIASPVSGTQIQLTVGQKFPIKLKNAMGCHFDYSAIATDPLLLDISAPSGMDLTKAVIVITGLLPGETDLVVESMNGTCPPATHTYPVTVEADINGVLKEFDATAKSELKNFRFDYKVDLNLYKSTLKDVNVSYKDGALTDDQLQDSFHVAATTLRKDIVIAGTFAYAHVIETGTELLAANGIDAQAPMEMFAGGRGGFDKFQNSICGEFADFHADFTKASGSGIKGFEKLGAPRFGQWNTLPPIFSGGPFYASQLGQYEPPQTLAGPMTFTMRPTTNEARDNGRLLVSGRASSSFKTPYHVILRHEQEGEAPVVMDVTPDVLVDEWSVNFDDLVEGAWLLRTGYEDDAFQVEVLLDVPSQDP